MPLGKRYTPEWAPQEQATIGLDYSAVLPPGVGIAATQMQVLTNTANPAISPDFTGPDAAGIPGYFTPQWRGRTIYTQLVGGIAGTDYQLRWSVQDTSGNVWPRTALLLCAPTS